MAYTLGNKCAKNLCKWTVLLQLIIKNVVTCFFFGTQCSLLCACDSRSRPTYVRRAFKFVYLLACLLIVIPRIDKIKYLGIFLVCFTRLELQM